LIDYLSLTELSFYLADDPTKRAEDLAESMADIKKKSSCCPNMTPFILMIALSVHSVFEGLALGLQLNEG